MKIFTGIKAMADAAEGFKRNGCSIGFVPTMGALHDGHLSLIRRARKENDKVVVSIFVNPAQFGPKEDLNKYPRNLKRDAGLCLREKADIIFAPSPGEIYPRDYKTYVSVKGLSDVLCGKLRPGHFQGVATVVAKLLHIVRADMLYLGQKDAQQAVIIKKMVRDLNFPLKVKVMPIVREAGGLAMSSRNAYLSAQEKRDAAALYRALKSSREQIRAGIRDPLVVIKKMKGLIRKNNIKLEYLSIVDADSLKPLPRLKGKILIALAARVGRTRLIDNITVNL